MKHPSNPSVNVAYAKNNTISTNGGVLIMWALLTTTKIVDNIAAELHDPRQPGRIIHSTTSLLRDLLLMLAQGWTTISSVTRLRHDPALCMATSDRRGTRPLNEPLPSQPTLSRFLHRLGSKANLAVLQKAITSLTAWRLQRRNNGKKQSSIVFDVDAIPVQTHGKQPGSNYHGGYKQTMYNPVIASCGETGDMLDVVLRPGTAHALHGGFAFIRRVARRLRKCLAHWVIVRLDAGYNSGELCTQLEKEDIDYVMRQRSNPLLKKQAVDTYVRPVDEETCIELTYKGGKWGKKRRLVLVLVPLPGELFPRFFYLLTSLTRAECSAEDLLALYRKRGKAEAHMGEMKKVLGWALSSTPRPKSHYRGKPIEREDKEDLRAEGQGKENEKGGEKKKCHDEVYPPNEAWLSLIVLAYQLLHIGRCIMEEETDQPMSLKTFRKVVLDIPGRVTKHARTVTFVIADYARDVWQQFWRGHDRVRGRIYYPP